MPPTIHLAGNGKLCKDEETDKLKYHDQSEADLCCGTCINCEDNKAPQSFKVTITGSANAVGEVTPCDHCADFDGNYIVPVQDPVPVCLWWTFIEDHCDRVLAYEPYIRVQIMHPNPTLPYILRCTLFYGRAHPYGSNGVLIYQKEFPCPSLPCDPPDCTEIDVTMTYSPDLVTDTVYICDAANVVMDILAL